MVLPHMGHMLWWVALTQQRAREPFLTLAKSAELSTQFLILNSSLAALGKGFLLKRSGLHCESADFNPA